MFEVFNKVLKGARSLPVTALVQLTFLGSIGTLLQEGNKVIKDWNQISSILHILMLRLRYMWLKLDHLRLYFTITTRGDFMSSQREVEHIASTYITINVLVVRHLYMDFPIICCMSISLCRFSIICSRLLHYSIVL